MIRWIGLSALLFSTQAYAQFPACPDGTVEQLTEFRDGAIAQVEANNLSSVAGAIKACYPVAEEVPSCLERTLHYSLKNDVASQPNSGPTQEERRRPPKEMQLSVDSFENWRFPPNMEEIVEQNGWIGAKYKSRRAGGFDSGTASLYMVYIPGESLNPPVSYDRWLNFPLPSDEGTDRFEPLPQAPIPTDSDYMNGGMPSTFTMVTLEHATNEKPGEVFFQMFRRQSGENRWTPSSSRNCGTSCHPNGLRAIAPLGYQVDDPLQYNNDPDNPGWFKTKLLPLETWLNVKAINRAMETAAKFKAVSWRGTEVNGEYKPFLRMEHNWPHYGPAAPLNAYTRSREFILGGTIQTPEGERTVDGCFNDRTQITHTDIFGRRPGSQNRYSLSDNAAQNIDWQKVKNAMSCGGCHNNKMRASLHSGNSATMIDFKILTDKSMPLFYNYSPNENRPEDRLNLDERIALANCLQAEFKEEESRLAQYLSQNSCE